MIIVSGQIITRSCIFLVIHKKDIEPNIPSICGKFNPRVLAIWN